MNNRIEEISKRVEATTPGKWTIENYPYNGHDDPVIVADTGIYIAQTVYDMQSCTQKHNIDADTIFIANAKEDILYLLSVIEELNKCK